MPAICKQCDQDMTDSDCCTIEPLIYPDGAEFAPVLHSGALNCRDCNASHGFAHHVHCCVERCPRCEGQLISCACGEPPEVTH